MKLLIIKTKDDNRLLHKLLLKLRHAKMDKLTRDASDIEFEGYDLKENEAVVAVLDNKDNFAYTLGKQDISKWMI